MMETWGSGRVCKKRWMRVKNGNNVGTNVTSGENEEASSQSVARRECSGIVRVHKRSVVGRDDF